MHIPAKYNPRPAEPFQKPTAPTCWCNSEKKGDCPFLFGLKNRRALMQPNPGDTQLLQQNGRDCPL